MPTLVALAVLGGLTVHIMASSRMCFAGARNGHMPELLAHINMKCMSPLPSLVFLVSKIHSAHKKVVLNDQKYAEVVFMKS